jgi:hypothetical protein
LAVLSNKVFHFIFSVQALNNGDVHTTRSLCLPSSDLRGSPEVIQ